MNITKTFFRFTTKSTLADIPHLKEFLKPKSKRSRESIIGTPRFHIETYGCQMNVNDS